MTDPPRRASADLSAPTAISADHDLAGFDCGEPALNDWLTQRAFRNESRFARTYVVRADNRAVAFYCVSAGAVERTAAPGKLRRNAPDAIPVAVIGRLAVDSRYAGRGLGADLLSDALRRVALASRTIGIAAALVHAKDDKARRFYMKRAEFLEYPADSHTLFLPIDTIIQSLD